MRAISNTQIHTSPEEFISVHPDYDGKVTVIAKGSDGSIRLQFTPAEAQALAAGLDLAAHIAEREE